MAEANGGPAANPLSEREMEVAQSLVTGASNAEIARDLVISPHTVKVHLRNIFEKLQVNSRTEASMLLVQRGWVSVPGVELAGAELPPPPPLPPEPEPLADLPPAVFPWQIGYLVAALVASLLLVLAPTLISAAQAPANLLTDAGQPVSAPAAVRAEPRWEVRTPLQTARNRLAVATLDGQLYAIGGETQDGAAVDTVSVYDLPSNEWSQAQALPVALANAAAASAGGKVYVAGGSVGADSRGADSRGADSRGAPELSAVLYEYDPDKPAWTERAQLPRPLAGAALVAEGDALYLIGGWDGREMHDEIWRYPLDAAPETAWELAGHLSKARAFLGAAPVGGEIYIIGGYDGQRELDLAEVFTPATGERRQLPPLGTPRGGLAVVYDGLAVYALGGGWTHNVTTHERYDPATNVWSNFPSPLQGEWRNLGAAASDGHLHLVGGWSDATLDLHLEYQSSFRALLPVISND